MFYYIRLHKCFAFYVYFKLYGLFYKMMVYINFKNAFSTSSSSLKEWEDHMGTSLRQERVIYQHLGCPAIFDKIWRGWLDVPGLAPGDLIMDQFLSLLFNLFFSPLNSLCIALFRGACYVYMYETVDSGWMVALMWPCGPVQAQNDTSLNCFIVLVVSL